MKKFLTIILLSIITTSLTSCGGASTNQDVSKDQEEHSIHTEQPNLGVLTNFSKEDLARFTMSSIMGQPSKDIKVQLEDELYYITYVRKSDSRKFDYKIKIDGNRIFWADINGRWRDSEYDEKINFLEADSTIKIIQTFSDGSTDIKEFKKGE